MDFATIFAIAKEAYDWYNKLKNWLDFDHHYTNDEIAGLINHVMLLVERTRREIVLEIQETRLADLIGDVNGLLMRFREYTIYDKETQHEQWQLEGSRLLQIVDDSADVISDLEAELARLDLDQHYTLLNRIPDVEHAAKVYPLLTILTPFRVIAMTERTRNYGTEDIDHIPPIWIQLKDQTDKVYEAFRYVIENGFSGIITRDGEPDGRGGRYVQIGYKFKNSFVLLYEAAKSTNSILEKARKQLEKRKANYLCLQIDVMAKAELEPYSLESLNYPGYFIRHQDFLGKISEIKSDLDKRDSAFKILPGLADNVYISFESVNYPGYYLRHRNFRIYLDPKSDEELFQKDATFKKVPGIEGSAGGVSFESTNYPRKYIRHRNYQLYLEEEKNDLFKKDATFKIVDAEYSGK